MSRTRVFIFVLAVAALGGCATSSTALDLDGRAIDPLSAPDAAATVLLFVSSECPIANRFAPEFNRLHERFASEDVVFWLVYADPAATPASIRTHLADYGYRCRAIRDPDHVLVTRTGATITPEAAVFTADGRMVYRGRINDRFVKWGRTRIAATQHDLADAIEGVLEGTADELVTTPAIGCYLVDLR